MENLCVNNLRVLSVCEIEKAKSGHPGVALSAAPIFFSLYSNIMDYDIDDDKFLLRDRFVASAGHASSLLYATLHLFGFDLTMEDLKNFRQLGSKTPGHPEIDKTSGIDCSTGPLGQGVSNAVGMAIAGKYYMETFNKPNLQLFDNKIYCFVGDGCLMEGISYEATSIAGNLNLDNLIIVYDCNKRTIDGNIDITWTDDIKKRFEAINFECFEVLDGNNVSEITNALNNAKNCKKPSIVIVNTKLGFGSEFEDMSSVHGKPLTLEQIETLKTNLNIKVDNFKILPEVKKYVENKKLEIKNRIDKKRELLEKYKKLYPKDYEKLLNFMNFAENDDAIKILRDIKTDNEKSMREINFDIFNTFNISNMLGGSADVESSTKMYKKIDEKFSKDNYLGKKLCYGIREHAMAGISNGICLFGGLETYCSCFLSFMDYLKPALRMSVQMNLPVLYVFTHDSVLIGEDGPTHQAIEQLVSLRAIPNITVFRAYNDAEIKACYIHYLKTKKPTVLILSRSKYEMENTDINDALCGAYTINKIEDKNKIILISTGHDVEISLKASKILKEKHNINCEVVSMPSMEVFESQSEEYKNTILPSCYEKFSFESGSVYSMLNYVEKSHAFGLDKFGESGKPEQLIKYFKLTPEDLVEKILKNLKK